MTSLGQSRCPSCEAETEPGSRFCPSCGRVLVEACPSCGTETAVGTRFCAACGHRLDRPSAREEERKLVTVLFADLTGSTALGEQLDPERLRALLSEYFGAMASVIESQGGVVEKFIGDAVMAVFGIPAGHEDDAERALRAALGMQARLQELNAEIAARHGVQLAMRIGVDSGEVIAGTETDQFMVTGDVVNVAARLQQTAEPGDVAAGERTYLATRGAFSTEPLEQRELKGKSLPVRAWRVLGTAEIARPRGVPGISSRLVGRERELALLATLHQGSVDESRPALVTILGQAGIGKSRLTEEFIAKVGARPEAPAVYRGRCLPYGEGITYWALREILWGAAGILLGDPAEIAAEKLTTLGRSVFDEDQSLDSAEVDRVLFALATTAGIALPENPLEEVSPESIGEELGLAWPRFLSALASRRPTLVVIDDLHRGEPPLLDMVEHLVSRSSGPVFLLATARPELAEIRPRWSGRAGMSQLSLEPLSDTHAEELIHELLPSIGSGLRRRVLAAAEGNPLFAEEIVAHLVDRGALVHAPEGLVEVADEVAVTIPDTVRSLLAARVDALPAEEKRTLQDAAVVGRVFWTTTLEAMRDGAVRASLRALEEKGFVLTRPTSALPEQTELAFRHGLIREVAYESIPKGRRATAHADVGRWIEALAGDRREEYVELIAHHYESAARPEDAELAWPTDRNRREELRAKAVDALVEAGRAATTRFAIDQALAFGDRALALASSDSERLAALEVKARAAHAAVRADEAWSHYLEALELAEGLGDGDVIQRLRASATLFWTRYAGALTSEDWKPQAAEIVHQGLEHDDGQITFERGALLAGRAGFWIWNVAPYAKQDARRDAQRAVAIAQEIGSPTLLSYALDTLAMRTEDGFCESAELAERALSVGRTMEDRGEAHEMFVTASIAFADAGRFVQAADVGAEAAALAARLGPHRRLHAGSAQTTALLPLGRFFELAEATAKAPDLVAEEGMHTCFHGLAALAGHALATFELTEPEASKRALETYDAAAVSKTGLHDYRLVDILRPLIGVEDARRRAEQLEEHRSAQGQVYRLRVELQLSALEREWERLDQFAERARSLAKSACAPYLDWIADWGHAVELAACGQIRESIAKARAAASALEAYGERYLGTRLLVDLLPFLEAHAANELAGEAIPRLEAMGAAGSIAEAGRSLSRS